MLNLGSLNDDPVLLQQAFDKYHYWGAIRAVFQIVSFFACVLAMGRVFVIKYIKP